jgi:hypothetical protein
MLQERRGEMEIVDYSSTRGLARRAASLRRHRSQNQRSRSRAGQNNTPCVLFFRHDSPFPRVRTQTSHELHRARRSVDPRCVPPPLVQSRPGQVCHAWHASVPFPCPPSCSTPIILHRSRFRHHRHSPNRFTLRAKSNQSPRLLSPRLDQSLYNPPGTRLNPPQVPKHPEAISYPS